MRAVYWLLLLHWVAAANDEIFKNDEESINAAQDRNDDGAEALKATKTINEVFNGLKEYVPETPKKELAGMEQIFKFKPSRTDRALKGLKKIFKMLGPALGIAGALLSAFIPDGTSKALEEIKSKLDNIDDKLNFFQEQMNENAIKAEYEHALTRTSPDINALYMAGESLDTYLEIPSFSDFQDTMKQLYDDKALLYEHIVKAYGTLNGKIFNNANLFEDMYRATKGDWNYINKMYMRIQSLLLKGIAAYTLGCKLLKKSTKECESAGLYLQGINQVRQTTLENNVEAALMKCRTQYFENRRYDVDKFARENSELDNQDMADKIAKLVRKKYFWKDQTVLVYNDNVIGPKNHDASGGLFLEYGKRKIRILDGDTVPNPFATSTTTPAKTTRCDIVQSCEINDGNSLFGARNGRGLKGRGWYRNRANVLRQGIDTQLRQKGFTSSQTAVIQKSKTVQDWFEKNVKASYIKMRYNLGKNGIMIVGGTNTELHKDMYALTDSTYYYFFIQLKNREIEKICDGDEHCCRKENTCGLGEGDCDTHLDCISGTFCGENSCRFSLWRTNGFWEDSDDCCAIMPSSSWCTAENCVENGVYWNGNRIGAIIEAGTAKDCSCMCEAVPSCDNWTFISAESQHAQITKNECWLKKGGLDQRVVYPPTVKAVSGRTRTDNCPVKNWCTPENCIESGVYYNGKPHSILHSADMTAKDCSCKCNAEPSCNNWTFVNAESRSTQDGKNECWLKMNGLDQRFVYPAGVMAVSGRTRTATCPAM